MAAKLEWDKSVPSLMLINESGGGEEMAHVRTLRTGYDYVRYVGPMYVSTPYESEADARQDAESEVRRLLKDAGVTLEG